VVDKAPCRVILTAPPADGNPGVGGDGAADPPDGPR